MNELIEILEAMTAQKDTTDPDTLFFDVAERIVRRASRAFGVKKDEVAILMLRDDKRQLRFVAPRQFANVAMIPVTKRDAIAVGTLTRRTGEAINNVPMVRHITLFENIRIKERALPIQKMISVPIMSNGDAVGVAQISRKGETPAAAGPDFTAEDVRKAQELFSAVGPYLDKARPAAF